MTIKIDNEVIEHAQNVRVSMSDHKESVFGSVLMFVEWNDTARQNKHCVRFCKQVFIQEVKN